MTNTLYIFKNSLEEIEKQAEHLSHQLQKDLVEGLETYEKHQFQQNKIMLKKGNDVWIKLSQDKQLLTSAREDYITSMNTFTLARKKKADKASKRERAGSDLSNGSHNTNSSSH